MATVKNFKKYQYLTQAINSTPYARLLGGEATNTRSVLFRILDETTIKATYICVVNFPNSHVARELQKIWIEEGIDTIKKACKNVEEEFSIYYNWRETGEKGPSSKSDVATLTINTNTISDSIEFLTYKAYSPTNSAYLRVECLVDVKITDKI